MGRARRSCPLHFTAQYPVFINGKKFSDYNGSPNANSVDSLKEMLSTHFLAELQALPKDALLVPLGNTVGSVVERLKEAGKIPQSVKQYDGRYVAPPHPAGSAAECRSLLLMQTYPDRERYSQEQYDDYLRRKPWVKKNRDPEGEATYKGKRGSYWDSMLLVRRAYGID